MSFVLLWIVCSLLALGISHFLPLRDLPATLVGDHWAHWIAGYWAAFFLSPLNPTNGNFVAFGLALLPGIPLLVLTLRLVSPAIDIVFGGRVDPEWVYPMLLGIVTVGFLAVYGAMYSGLSIGYLITRSV